MADRANHKPDLAKGVNVVAFGDGSFLCGTFGGEEVLLVRTPSGIRAIGPRCTHNGAPLAKGLVVGDTVRCPWHHACFDTARGDALAAPAFGAVSTWTVREQDGVVTVTGKRPAPDHPAAVAGEPIIVIGAGAAGAAAADALARLGHGHRTVLIGHEAEAPYDRTVLTKHFLSGQIGEDQLALAMEDLAARGVDVRLGTTVAAIDPEAQAVRLTDGRTLPFARLILATGAEPNRLDVPGTGLPHVRTLRSADDARAILDAAARSRAVVVVGGSFIGLEAAAALRDAGHSVTVVARGTQPFARVFGPAVAEAILARHRARGTPFHLGRDVVRIEADHLQLDDGTRVPADLVILGVGVSPRTALAEHAGLKVEDGVVVDERLRTSHRNIFAVGDIARWPDPHSGRAIRVEHWAVAQRQGQIAAANATGQDLRFDAVPFFWTLHFDYSARYLGHAAAEDEATLEGAPADKDAVVRFGRDGHLTALVTVERDGESLAAECSMERRLGHRAEVFLPA